MTFQESILFFLSRAPDNEDYDSEESERTIDNSLSLLEKEYPNFGTLVAGKRVADFGCGLGNQTIALAQKYGCSVVGIDSNKNTLNKAAENARPFNTLQTRLSFTSKTFTKITKPNPTLEKPSRN